MSLGYPRFTSFSLIFALLALAVVFVPKDGRAQTAPVTEIETAAGDSVLTVFDDGGFAVYGESGTGTIPVEGEGTRMMWYPAKGAFRAGTVGDASGTENYWDADNVGTHSVAFGTSTRATASNATAMGQYTTASGANATAMGYGTTASGGHATAMGDFTVAATNNSLSIGRYNYTNTSADNTLFVVGNGGFTINGLVRSDALVLDGSGNLDIAGGLTENSDRRLKEQIQPLGKDLLEKIEEIRPVRFHFKNEETHPSGTQLGLVAQEVQAQFPELVSEGASGYLSVSYSKFTAVLLKGVQEQQAEIERLRAKVDRVDTLEARLAKLERQGTARAAWHPKGALSLAGGAVSGGGWTLVALLGLLIGGVFAWRRRG